jgi:hypothetical protein
MKQINQWLFSVQAFRILSLVLCAYLAITALGVSGSYKDAFDSIVLFYVIWLLGHESREVRKIQLALTHLEKDKIVLFHGSAYSIIEATVAAIQKKNK